MLEVLKTKTIKDTVIVTAGMVLSTILSAASIFLLARWLGPDQFGLYVAALALAVIVTDALDLAISASLVNFGAKGGEQSSGLVKFGFYLKLGLGLGLGGLFALVSQPLARWLYPALGGPLLSAALIIPLAFLQRFPRSILQSQKRFWADSSLEVAASGGRLAGVAAFYWFGRLTPVTGLIGYLTGFLASFVIGSGLISWKFLTAAIDKDIRLSFFHFQKWLTLGYILAAIHGRIDSTILVKLTGAAATGIYQAGFRFFMPVMQLAAALSLVFAPRFAGFASQAEARTYLKKAATLTAGLSVGVLGIIPLAPWLVGLIFGPAYASAVLPTRILALGFASFIAAAPFTAYLIYSRNRTKVFALINLFQLVLLISLDFWLMPKFGAAGAAAAISATLIAVNLLIMLLALR